MANEKNNATWVISPNGERTEEVDYLVSTRGLEFFERDGNSFFKLKTIEGFKTYPAYGSISFHDIKRGEDNKIYHLNFHVDNSVYWKGEDGTDTSEIKYMQKKYDFITDPDSATEAYRLKVDDKWYSYPQGTQFKFYDEKFENGEITSLRFYALVRAFKNYFPNERVPEIRYMEKKYGLVIDPDTPDRMYRLTVQGKTQEHREGARIRFWDFVYNEKGQIVSLKFKFQYLKWV